MEIDEIKKILPHRYPFLFVDRITELGERSIEGIKNLSINEPFFQGHFPNYPIMPGVLIVEAMAQVGGILILKRIEREEDMVALFMGIDRARFRKPVRPGDQLRITAEILNLKGKVAKLSCKAYVRDEIVSEAEILVGLSKGK